ncbi:energy-coupling factor transporter ATPase [Staphylococcus kloosii]|uniref:energy-coupling factor transporter ATPase n=1 Tax=Staphylococcus kloosii TaxID=29384 RepID=UPI00189E96D2|nr:energy-coupling factor transporter ATPase [Staphylococcus kloosii]MBF7030753.1 energy-coupling factor transporter ATPase [Staphylococcus kloosii]
MQTNGQIIKFNHVSFKYKSDEPYALKDVSFAIPKGKWTSIVGHNGSGKSTLAKLMVGIEQANEGNITYNNQVIDNANLQVLRKSIGIVFQNPENQFVGSTVEFDVAFGLENHAVPYDEMHDIVPKALSDVQMLDRANKEPQSLSGGQKQRVAIAGVLALNTEVIILDEATSMLDPYGRSALMNLVRKLNHEKEVTIISITHDLSEAAEADNLIVLDKGEIFTTGTPQQVFDKGEALSQIALDLPFSMRINQLLGNPLQYISYEGLVSQL